jgi:hypothetical protein
MNIHIIKSEVLIKELIDRCSDQMADPEPQFDDVLSFMYKEQIDKLIHELSTALDQRKLRKTYGS